MKQKQKNKNGEKKNIRAFLFFLLFFWGGGGSDWSELSDNGKEGSGGDIYICIYMYFQVEEEEEEGVKDTRAPLALAHVRASCSFQGSGSRLSRVLNSCTSLTRVYEASVRANCSGTKKGGEVSGREGKKKGRVNSYKK